GVAGSGGAAAWVAEGKGCLISATGAAPWQRGNSGSAFFFRAGLGLQGVPDDAQGTARRGAAPALAGVVRRLVGVERAGRPAARRGPPARLPAAAGRQGPGGGGRGGAGGAP